MKLQFFYLILGSILMASTNEHSVAKSGTHKVSCNKVHLREFPNFNSKSLELIEAGAQVTYLKESRFKEKLRSITKNVSQIGYFVHIINRKVGFMADVWNRQRVK